MRTDLFVYISGPMTAKHGYTVEENVAAGLRIFLDCLKRGVEPETSGADNLKTFALVEAAYRSAASGETVHL